MTYSYIHFFNLQYWYCVFVSLFGARCTDAELGIPTTTPSVSAPSVSGSANFWGWLFGFHGASAPHSIFGAFIGLIAAIFGFLWSVFSFFSYVGSFFLFLAIVGCAGGIFLIRLQDAERYGNLPPASSLPRPLQARWESLLANAMSQNPLEWREAILGADVLLGELFEKLGYQGTNTAERIRKIPEGAFANLPSAWEAHRIKNFVFAASSHFILTQREAFRVMKLYEQVFKEFDFI